ncbi:mRNA-capping enzyme subunit alpha [Myriangium duriaei CBS 260.36]|uniref:mRNA-capping enzyme subunit alpha n=1 Tax=Myriangium duriaei CBS 260.36 TaxID=1168546 RepID=A0A9P4IW34_9PEZI|nr:mRNA-capping enzyme subunit alpha [Myriangium duriaei CBS 260.36]
MSGLLQLSDVANKVPNEDIEMFRDRIADLLNRKSRGFPGAQPVSFSKKHFNELQRADYYLCEKTDGIRCLLYLTYFVENDGSRREACFLIDRKNDYYHIDNPHFHFPLPGQDPSSFHVETLLDGELVLDSYPSRRSVRRYLVFDCLAMDGQSLLQKTLDKRIGAVKAKVIEPQQQLFKKYPEEIQEQPFEVAAKDLQKAYGIEMMFRDVLPNLPHGNDGLVFTCRTSEYSIGTDQHIIKWKPPAENTIDFRLQLGDFPRLSTNGHTNGEMDEDDNDYSACPELSLLVNHGSGRHQVFAPLYVTDDEWESVKSMNAPIDARIIECYKDASQRWRFKREKDGTPRFRDDKNDANHISTVESVLESIEDAVSEQDLLNRSAEIRGSWKRREQHETEQRRAWEREEADRRKRVAE